MQLDDGHLPHRLGQEREVAAVPVVMERRVNQLPVVRLNLRFAPQGNPCREKILLPGAHEQRLMPRGQHRRLSSFGTKSRLKLRKNG